MVRVWKKRVGISIMAVILMLGQCALAEIVRVEVEGFVDSTVTAGPYELDGSVVGGTAMTGFCVYDTEAPPLDIGYYRLIDISMSVGSYEFRHNPDSSDPAEFIAYVDPGYAAHSQNTIFEGIVFKDGSPIGWTDQPWSGTFYLMDLLSSYEEYFIGRHLPTAESFPPFWVFDARAHFDMAFGKPGEGFAFGIEGHLTDVRAVPEPGCAALMTAGLLLFRSCRKRR